MAEEPTTNPGTLSGSPVPNPSVPSSIPTVPNAVEPTPSTVLTNETSSIPSPSTAIPESTATPNPPSPDNPNISNAAIIDPPITTAEPTLSQPTSQPTSSPYPQPVSTLSTPETQTSAQSVPPVTSIPEPTPPAPEPPVAQSDPTPVVTTPYPAATPLGTTPEPSVPSPTVNELPPTPATPTAPPVPTAPETTSGGEMGPSWMRQESSEVKPENKPAIDPAVANAPLPWQVPDKNPEATAPNPQPASFETTSVAKPGGFPVMLFVVLILGIIVAIGIFLYLNHALPSIPGLPGT